MAPATENMPRRRDFIIGSLYRYGQSEGLAEPTPRRATLGEVLALGNKVVEQHQLEARSTTDLSKVATELRNSLGQMTQSPVMRAVMISRALERLSVESRAQLALTVAYDWTDVELSRIAAGGLRMIRSACTAAEPALAEHAVRRLDQLLARSTVLVVEKLSNGSKVVAECDAEEARRAVRDYQLQAEGGKLDPHTKVILVLPAVECPTPRAALLEYLHLVSPGTKKVSSKELLPVSSQKYEAPRFVQWAKVAWQKLRSAELGSDGRAQSAA